MYLVLAVISYEIFYLAAKNSFLMIFLNKKLVPAGG
jgi:hypothetical protein